MISLSAKPIPFRKAKRVNTEHGRPRPQFLQAGTVEVVGEKVVTPLRLSGRLLRAA